MTTTHKSEKSRQKNTTATGIEPMLPFTDGKSVKPHTVSIKQRIKGQIK